MKYTLKICLNLWITAQSRNENQTIIIKNMLNEIQNSILVKKDFISDA